MAAKRASASKDSASKERSSKETAADFDAVFSALQKILNPYAKRTTVKEDSRTNYTLIAGRDEKKKMDIWFACAVIQKSYVSFHLMPIYMNDALQATVSPELKKRMQGKACFNFKRVEPELFRELAGLTKRGFESFERDGYIRK